MSRPGPANADGVFEPFPMADVPWQEHAHGRRFGMLEYWDDVDAGD